MVRVAISIRFTVSMVGNGNPGHQVKPAKTSDDNEERKEFDSFVTLGEEGKDEEAKAEAADDADEEGEDTDKPGHNEKGPNTKAKAKKDEPDESEAEDYNNDTSEQESESIELSEPAKITEMFAKWHHDPTDPYDDWFGLVDVDWPQLLEIFEHHLDYNSRCQYYKERIITSDQDEPFLSLPFNDLYLDLDLGYDLDGPTGPSSRGFST